jgi:NADH:ubiquinone oxidoreductase subunit 4 (subunit M)
MASEYYAPIIYTLSILGVIYASMTTIRQTDLKRIIAYSSVGHMGIVTIGIFANNVAGVEGVNIFTDSTWDSVKWVIYSSNDVI